MLVVIDNYDSFTYNLVHYLEEFEQEIDVFRNDEITIDQLKKYSHILISPGPGLPHEVEFLNTIYKEYSKSKNILGICLGMQAMVAFYKGDLYNLPEVLHGRQGLATILIEDPLFNKIKTPFLIGHYHSWGVNNEGLPNDLSVLVRDSEERIMAIKHKDHSTYGIQFHPESVLCPEGKIIIYNWLKET